MGKYPAQLAPELLNRLQPKLNEEFLFHSRVHPLSHFGDNVYVKREDESGFSCSGTKKRKFASLIPYLERHGIQLAILVGGANSNHIVALSQILLERKIPFHLFLKQSNQAYLQGNAFLLKLLTAGENISWVAHEDWSRVNDMAIDFGKKSKARWMVIPEGGKCQGAVAGAATLMLDIIKNERHWLFNGNNPKVQGTFDHIWIDSGTALTAGVLVSTNLILKRSSQIHVVLMAGDEQYFKESFRQINEWLGAILRINGPKLAQCHLHFPVTGKSFGSTNAQVRHAIVDFARSEGLLTDPIYTAKLFLTAKSEISSGKYPGSHLIIHSGGGTGLMGFADKMAKVM